MDLTTILLITLIIFNIYQISISKKQKNLFSKVVKILINIEKENKKIYKAFNLNEKINKLDNSTLKTLNELELNEIFFNNVSDGIVILNKEKKIVSINQGFTELTGFQEQDCLNKSLSILSSDAHSKNIYNSIVEDDNNLKKLEISSRKNSGEIFPARVTVNSVFDNEQNITNYVIMIRDFTEEKEKEVKLLKLAKEDYLTKLPNRTAFSERLTHSISVSDREKNMFSLAFIDLDDFKPINDTYGHDVGDEVLIEVSKRLKDSLRGSDFISRAGGDEFVLILSPLKNAKDIENIKEKVLNNLCKQFITKNGHTIDISGSMGYAIYPNDISDNSENKEEDIYKAADKAMYEIKQRKKNDK